MEKFITTIQSNTVLNAVKEAIINLANMNIAVSLLSLVYVLVGQTLGIPSALKEQLAFIYTIYMLVISLVLGYRVLDILKRDWDGIDSFVGVLALLMMNRNLVMSGNLVPLLILTMVQAPIVGYAMKSFSTVTIPMKGVPPAVEKSLNGVISPVITAGFAFSLSMMPGVMELLSLALTTITGFIGSYVVIILAIIAISTIWVKGLHGVATISTLLRPFWFYMMFVNGYFVIMGETVPYIGTEAFMQWGVWIGGSGCTLGLTFAMKYFAKSTHLKTIGNDAFNSNLFNINENIVFGVPVAENDHFKIPFFLAPILCATVTYFAMSLGYVTPTSIVMPWVLPAPLGLFLSTLFDVNALFLGMGLIGISFAVYYPFMRNYDKQLLQEEKGS